MTGALNPALARLKPYPFERLAKLLEGCTPPQMLRPIALSIGEPRHTPPPLIGEALTRSLGLLGQYPATAGTSEFREAAGGWLRRRYALGARLDPETMLLPVNGTREALFAIAQALVDPAARLRVVLPNPFYQIYEGAALLAGAEPFYLDAPAAAGFVPEFSAVPRDVWNTTRLLYLCSPGNPTGAVLPLKTLTEVLTLADRHDFTVVSDECYAEIYPDERKAPPGLLEACRASGRDDFRRALVFHSLSKRSSVPGLRSGFVAGDARLIERFRLYRTYHGSAMPGAVQAASIAAWNDEAHVLANRALYRAKFEAVLPRLAQVLKIEAPAAGFYLWPEVGPDDEAFARELYAATAVTVVPGSYLAREGRAGNPGRGRVRISLVASLEESITAAERIVDFLTQTRGTMHR